MGFTKVKHSRGIGTVLSPREGYGLFASSYERWHWFRFWRENEFPLVERWLASLSPGLLLDAGSGTGLYHSAIRRAGHQAVSLDITLEMLQADESKNATNGWTRPAARVQGDIRFLPFRNLTFDCLLCARVLSHVSSVSQVFSEFSRVLKPGACMLVSDVHPDHPYQQTALKIPALGEKIVVETYKHPITELKRIMGEGSFRLLSMRELGLDDLLWKPPYDGFEKIYDDPRRAIFYISYITRV